MRFYLSVVILLALQGCAQRTLVLHNQALSHSRQEQVLSLLNTYHFSVSASDHPLTGHSGQALLLIPATASKSDYTSLHEALKQTGWPTLSLQVAPASSADNNAHLYLSDPDNAASADSSYQKVISTYEAYRCNEKASLTLQADHHFVLSRTSLDGTHPEQHLSGQWVITQWPYIRLTAKIPYAEQFLEVSEHIEKENNRQFRVVSLRPLEVSRYYTPCPVKNTMRIN